MLDTFENLVKTFEKFDKFKVRSLKETLFGKYWNVWKSIAELGKVYKGINEAFISTSTLVLKRTLRCFERGETLSGIEESLDMNTHALLNFPGTLTRLRKNVKHLKDLNKSLKTNGDKNNK